MKPEMWTKRDDMMRRPIWMQALIFFAIFVPAWLLFNVITGEGFSGQSLINAVITGAVAAVLYGLLMFLYEKWKNRN